MLVQQEKSWTCDGCACSVARPHRDRIATTRSHNTLPCAQSCAAFMELMQNTGKRCAS